MNLATLSTGGTIYWLFDNEKTPDLLDFDIIKGIKTIAESCFELYLDHSPAIFTIKSKIMTKGNN